MKERVIRLGVAVIAIGVVVWATQAMLPSPGRANAKPLSKAIVENETGNTGGKELLKQFSLAFEQAAGKVNQSVVSIMSEQRQSNGISQDPFQGFFGDEFFGRFFGPNRQRESQPIRAMGSGVIVSRDGYILTNNHVVKDAQNIVVQLDNKKKYPATVVGTDPQTDIAVIKIEGENLPMANLGNSDSVRVGDWVIAVGNPFELLHTVTTGIISAKGRSGVGLADYEDFLQTDASINPGNSGGALADLDGNVIGINTAISSPSGGNVGIGFAIPINLAKHAMSQLIEHGKVTRGLLGLVPQDIDETLAKALKLKSTSGVLVGDVSKDGPAEKAGIKQGDVLISMDGKLIQSAAQLRQDVAAIAPGTSTHFELLRDGTRKGVTAKIGERPADSADGRLRGNDDTHEASSIGVTVQDLTPSLAQQLGFEGVHGVVIVSVKPGSPLGETGLTQGDLIKEVNRKAIHSVQEFNKALLAVPKGGSIALLVQREEHSFFVAVDKPS